jgi:hypothetical protein
MAASDELAIALELLVITVGGNSSPAPMARPGTPRPPSAAELFVEEEVSGMKTPTNQPTRPVNAKPRKMARPEFMEEVARRLFQYVE